IKMTLTPQVVSLLTERLKLDPSDLLSLQSGNYAQFFRERIAADPALAGEPVVRALIEHLTTAASAPAPEEHEADDDDDDHRSRRIIDVQTAEDVASQALAALRHVAGIMGACDCWGQNKGCRDCYGRGEPGFRRPRDPGTFVAWVQPGLEKLGLRLERVRTSPQRINKPEE